MLHRSIMLHAEDRTHVLIARLCEPATSPERQALLDELTEIEASVHEVAYSVVGCQHVMDELDDNILVADKDEMVLYVNDACVHRTSITPEQILGKRITELLETGTYSTNPTAPEMIRDREKIIKLSNMLDRPDSLGFVTGVPIFGDAGETQYVVACNRGVSTFRELRDNFVHFMETVSNLQGTAGHVQMVSNSSGIIISQAVGGSPVIQQMYDLIESVRQIIATILIAGESGVDKELTADTTYRTSSWAERLFIKISRASISASLFKSELLGYECGSPSETNASDRQGLFEAANDGTLLLDEIGEMPMNIQAKLLQVIQNNEITWVGGIRPVRLNTRCTASINCDLKKKVWEGTFRSDLYYRLHVIPIQVSPLWEWEGDVAWLSQHFVSEFNKQYHKNVVFSPENIELLENYFWSGNVQELHNVMGYLVVCYAPNGHVNNSYIYGTFDPNNRNTHAEYDPDQSLNNIITAHEKKYLESVPWYAHNLEEASQIPDIDPSTVSRRLRQRGLTLQGGQDVLPQCSNSVAGRFSRHSRAAACIHTTTLVSPQPVWLRGAV